MFLQPAYSIKLRWARACVCLARCGGRIFLMRDDYDGDDREGVGRAGLGSLRTTARSRDINTSHFYSLICI